MNILVCFKAVPNLDMMPPEEFTADEKLAVDVRFVPWQTNCYDESALEMARKLAKVPETECTLTALTIGGEQADAMLKTLYALGYDKAVRVQPCRDIRFSPDTVAEIIAAYAREHAVDVILTGVQSPEGDNAQTPLMLAEMLGWPCITQVTELGKGNTDSLTVTNTVDGGTLKQEIRLPAVLSIGDAPSTYLQVPTLKDRMRRGKQPIEVIPMEGLALSSTGAQSCLNALRKTEHKRRGEIIAGDTVQEKAETLYRRYLKGVLEQL